MRAPLERCSQSTLLPQQGRGAFCLMMSMPMQPRLKFDATSSLTPHGVEAHGYMSSSVGASFVAENPLAKTRHPAKPSVSFQALIRFDWTTVQPPAAVFTVTGTVREHLQSAAQSAAQFIKDEGQHWVTNAVELLPWSAPLHVIKSSVSPKRFPAALAGLPQPKSLGEQAGELQAAYKIAAAHVDRLTQGPLHIDMKAWAHSDSLFTVPRLIENGFSLKEPLTSKDLPAPAMALFNLAKEVWNHAEKRYDQGIHISPQTTAALVDAALPMATLLTTKKIRKSPGAHQAVPPVGQVQMRSAGNSKKGYFIPGTKAALSVQHEPALTRSAWVSKYTIKDFKISLDRNKGEDAYRLLEHVLDSKKVGFETTSVLVKVPINKTNADLLRELPRGSKLHDLEQSPLAQTSLGKTLLEHGITRISSVLLKAKKKSDGTTRWYAQIGFKR